MNFFRSPLFIGMILLPIILVFIFRKKGDAANKKETGSTGTAPKIQPNGKSCAGNPRGLRNNNPGNIRIGSSAWQGKIPVSQNTDGSFEQFETWVHGVRAMTKLVRNYILDGHNTINKIINRYAPPHENSTNQYIAFLVKETGIFSNKQIDPNDKTVIRRLIKGMAQMELGCNLITDAEFNKAWEML